MKITGLVLVFVFSLSCSDKGSVVSEQLSGSDKLIIDFTVKQDETFQVVTSERKAIEKLIRFADGKRTEEFKCGYDGTMRFFEKEILKKEVSFNYSGKDCRHFLIIIDGELYSTKMSNEAADFLAALKSGQKYY